MATRRVVRRNTEASATDRYKDDEKDYEPADEEKDYEQRPSRSRSRDEADDARPARRSRREEPEEEERPTRRRRAAAEEDEKPARGRRSRDEDEEPAAKRRQMKGGWGTAEKAQAASGDWAKTSKLTSEEVIFKFLDDEPFVVFGQHWIQERPGKKSFICLNDVTGGGKSECPLCDIGDKPRVFSAFNVLRLEPGEDPVLEVLQGGTRLTQALKDKNNGKDGPLTKPYWAINSSGKGTSTSYNVAAVKERDLEEDWDYIPLDEDELDDFSKDAYTSETYPDGLSSKRDLQEIVDEIA